MINRRRNGFIIGLFCLASSVAGAVFLVGGKHPKPLQAESLPALSVAENPLYAAESDLPDNVVASAENTHSDAESDSTFLLEENLPAKNRTALSHKAFLVQREDGLAFVVTNDPVKSKREFQEYRERIKHVTRDQLDGIKAGEPVSIEALTEHAKNAEVAFPYKNMAATAGRTELLRQMLEHTPPDSKQLNSLLSYSIPSGNIETVRYLLSLGAREPYLEIGNSHLHRAVRTSNDAVFISELINLGFHLKDGEKTKIHNAAWLQKKTPEYIAGLKQLGILDY